MARHHISVKHIMRLLIFYIISFFVPNSASGQSMPALAVLDLQWKGISLSQRNLIVDLLSYVLYENGTYFVISREEYNRKLKGIGFQTDRTKDEFASYETGEMLDADFIVTGSVIQSKEAIIFTLALLDVDNQAQVKKITNKYLSLSELMEDMREIAEKLITSGDSIPPSPTKNILQSIAPAVIKERILFIYPKDNLSVYEATSKSLLNMFCKNILKNERIIIYFTEVNYDFKNPDLNLFQTICRERDCHSMVFCTIKSEKGSLFFYNEDLVPRLELHYSLTGDIEQETENLVSEFNDKFPGLPIHLLVNEIKKNSDVQKKLDTLILKEQFLSKPYLLNVHQKFLKESIVNKYHPIFNIASLETDFLWYYYNLFGTGIGYGFSFSFPSTFDNKLEGHPLVQQHEIRFFPFTIRTAGKMGILGHISTSLNIQNACRIVDKDGEYEYEEKIILFLKAGISLGILFNLDNTFALSLEVLTLSYMHLFNKGDISFEGNDKFSGSIGGFGLIVRF